MFHLDVRTLFITATLLNLLICVWMLIFWRTQKTYPGFGLWVADNVALVPAFLFYALRGAIPDFFSIVVAGALVVFAAVIRLAGIVRFVGSARRYDWNFGLPVIIFLVLAWFTYGTDDALIRTAFLNGALAYCVTFSGILLVVYAQSGARLLYTAVATLFFIAGAIMVWHILVWYQSPVALTLLSPSLDNEIYYTYTLLLEAGLALSFLMLNSQRLTSELIESQRKVEEHNRRLVDIIDFLPDATFAIDADSRVVAWNRAMEELTGTAATSVLGKDDYVYAVPLYGEPRPMAANLVMPMYQGPAYQYRRQERVGQVLMVENDLTLPNGRHYVLWGKAAALFNLQGECTGAIESIRDLTDYRRQEQEIRQLNATLEAQVRERTAELAAAVEELKRAAKMKDEFMAAVSHELRTPLVGILGMAEVLETEISGPLNERQRHKVQLIEQSGQRLLKIINSILRFTGLIGGNVVLRREPCILADLCASSIQTVAESAEKKQLCIGCRVEPPDLQFTSDADGVLQTLQYLFDNAVKFTPEGGAIGVEATRNLQAETLDLVVWDTGIGIPVELQAVIFQPFVQGDGRLSRQYEGVGLGLAYVQCMVGLLGGTVIVESTPGRGSRFTIRLPLEAVQPGSEPLVASTSHNG